MYASIKKMGVCTLKNHAVYKETKKKTNATYAGHFKQKAKQEK